MFGLGQKRQEKKAKKELEKLEKKEAKVKEKLAKLEEKAAKKNKKKTDIPVKPKPVIYKFNAVGIEPHIDQIRFELMSYNPDFNDQHEDGDFVYKYADHVSRLDLVEKEGKIQVIADGYPIGFVPDDKLAEVQQFLSEHPDGDIYCRITGGEYKEYEGRKGIKGIEDYCVTVYLRYYE